ncbi:SDR family oxidoreductase [Acanthopleuribacter pedis]|uniref:Aldehyde reductase n=1 Tax=Acanthopleuribacter pedis TaxID=442870 RepID=A0A8J7Q6K2_9BACT|nr:aldehyde reductase [Acanthopleuribacter pedis]MBO1321472.1 aldehyde reductase [Acanthopleuribacter pedis]
MNNQTVLVTGISGYIGLHVAAELLRAGYQVRGSVRSLKKENEVRETMAAAKVDTRNLSFVELDLTQDNGWIEAVAGADYVLHVASPFALANPKHENDMIVPAVQGTLRALRAARAGKVKRFVLTSSVLSMMGSMKTGSFGPDSWTDTEAPNVSTYTKSKTMAEKAAWEYMADLPKEDQFEFTVVNPGGVIGPPLGRNVSGQTMTMVGDMIGGKMPMVPNAAFPMIDVRDVAKIHLAAMTHAEAPGKRFVASLTEPVSFIDMARTLKANGYQKVGTRIAPNFMLRLLSFFDREAKGLLGMLGMNLKSENQTTRSMFNWEPTPIKQSVLETAVVVQRINRAQAS